MGLWIKSQDKESLTKITNIQYSFVNNLHIIGTYYDNLKMLGTYKTKERALEVLDEICKYKDKLDKVHFLGMTESEFISSIYKMPQE